MKKFIRNQMLRRLKVLDEQLRKVAQGPRDAEGIHALRVATRRFSQCLRTFQPCLSATVVRKLRDRLRALLHHCGEVRNCDVTLALLDTLAIEDAPLRKRLRTRRRAADKALATCLSRWEGEQSLSFWRARLKINKHGDQWDQLLLAMTEEWFDAGDAAAVKGVEYDAMHHFRLLGKRLRYTLELFSELYAHALEKPLEQLRTVQDKLGQINDCVTALPLVKGHAQSEAALSKLLTLREQSFRVHWTRTLSRQRKPWMAQLGEKS